MGFSDQREGSSTVNWAGEYTFMLRQLLRKQRQNEAWWPILVGALAVLDTFFIASYIHDVQLKINVLFICIILIIITVFLAREVLVAGVRRRLPRLREILKRSDIHFGRDTEHLADWPATLQQLSFPERCDASYLGRTTVPRDGQADYNEKLQLALIREFYTACQRSGTRAYSWTELTLDNLWIPPTLAAIGGLLWLTQHLRGPDVIQPESVVPFVLVTLTMAAGLLLFAYDTTRSTAMYQAFDEHLLNKQTENQ